MAKKRPGRPNQRNRRGSQRGGPNRGGGGSALRLRESPGGAGWEFVLPPCAAERLEDLEEVEQMVEADEVEIATDELRYLLSGCPELLAAHVLLGQLAVTGEKPDLELARGHFGFAFALGEKALKQGGFSGQLDEASDANAPWREAARGLAWCLEKQGNGQMADQVVQTIRRYDPADPAEVAAMLDELRAGGLPIVELG